MISPWLAVTAALAAARVTRLITRDRITRAPRMRLVNALGVDTLGAYLITCDWCVGLWTAAVTMPAVWLWGHHVWLQLPLHVLAAAHVVGWLATREGD